MEVGFGMKLLRSSLKLSGILLTVFTVLITYCYAETEPYPIPRLWNRWSVDRSVNNLRFFYRLPESGGAALHLYLVSSPFAEGTLPRLIRVLSFKAGESGASRGWNTVPWDGRSYEGNWAPRGKYIFRVILGNRSLGEGEFEID